jgi:hypothetical protein
VVTQVCCSGYALISLLWPRSWAGTASVVEALLNARGTVL